MKLRAPVFEFISNKDSSEPPFKDQVIFVEYFEELPTVKVLMKVLFSSIYFSEIKSPSFPLGPLIVGAGSLILSTFILTNCSEELCSRSVALTFTS